MPAPIPPPIREGSEPMEVTCNTFTVSSPISINKAYTVVRGRTLLTSAGRKYKDAVKLEVSRSSFQWKAALDTIHNEGGYVELSITVYFEELYNKSWSPGAMTQPKPNKKTGIVPKAQLRNPYKKVDVGNMLKLLEDAIVSGCGIDDASHLDIHMYKRHDPNRPRVEVTHRTLLI